MNSKSHLKTLLFLLLHLTKGKVDSLEIDICFEALLAKLKTEKGELVANQIQRKGDAEVIPYKMTMHASLTVC